jgi:hypothetical protein
VAKKILGRGLGELLKEGERSAAREGSDSLPERQSLGPGMRVLAARRNGNGAIGGARATVTWNAGRAVTVASLFGADVLMVGLMVLWRWQDGSQMTGQEAFVCVSVLAFGSWLGGLGAWLVFRG